MVFDRIAPNLLPIGGFCSADRCFPSRPGTIANARREVLVSVVLALEVSFGQSEGLGQVAQGHRRDEPCESTLGRPALCARPRCRRAVWTTQPLWQQRLSQGILGRSNRAMRLFQTRRSLLLLLLSGQAILCSAALPRAKGSMPLRVEIDAYSGRTNPSFDLPPSDAMELAKLLRSLPHTKGSPPESGLGYRGFVISNDADFLPGLPPRVRVFAGRVIAEHGGQVDVYDDIHSAEDWLKQRATRAGYGALFN